MGVGSVVEGVVSINARWVCICFGQSRLKDFVLKEILRVKAGLSTSVIAETKVFDVWQAARSTAFLTNYPTDERELVGERRSD
jgi:hypothetical protein